MIFFPRLHVTKSATCLRRLFPSSTMSWPRCWWAGWSFHTSTSMRCSSDLSSTSCSWSSVMRMYRTRCHQILHNSRNFSFFSFYILMFASPQVVTSIGELVEMCSPQILSGWRPLFSALRTVHGSKTDTKDYLLGEYSMGKFGRPCSTKKTCVFWYFWNFFNQNI